MDHQKANPTETQRLLDPGHNGARAAFEELFAQHRTYLHQMVTLRLKPGFRSGVGPESVVEEARREAAKRLADYLKRPTVSFRLWLWHIAHERLLRMRHHHLGPSQTTRAREVPLSQRSTLVAPIPA
jgi:DNA-directed RNA polymerase specialized sigma24 family protein